MKDVCIIGIGMHPWGKFPEKSFEEVGVYAIERALSDAGLEWHDIGFMACSSLTWEGMMGILGGNAVSDVLGGRGIPVLNCQNACATSGSVFRSCINEVASGSVDYALALGLDRSPGGFFPVVAPNPKDLDYIRLRAVGAPNPVYWALSCRRRMTEFGTTERHLAKVKVKNSKHGIHNPNARYRREFSIEEVLSSPMVSDPLRLYEICATGDGAAAVIVCRSELARRLTTKPIFVASCALSSALYGDPSLPVPQLSVTAKAEAPALSESVSAARAAYEEAGIGPENVDVAELPDMSSWHELVYTEIAGFAEPGEADRMLDEGETSIGGNIPINPSGGSSSMGEAAGAQGLAMVCELVWQLREQAGARQVEGAKVGYCQVYGAQGCNSAVILKR